MTKLKVVTAMGGDNGSGGTQKVAVSMGEWCCDLMRPKGGSDGRKPASCGRKKVTEVTDEVKEVKEGSKEGKRPPQ